MVPVRFSRAKRIVKMDRGVIIAKGGVSPVWLFVAVGTKYLRLLAPGRDPVAVGKEILTAWQLPQRQLKPSGEKSGFVLLPMPAELREFVDQFDRGLLPEFQAEVDPREKQRLRELAAQWCGSF